MTTLDAIGDKLAAGETLGEADTNLLLATTDLIGLGILADAVRRRRHGNETTFVRVQEIEIDELARQTPTVLPAAGELRLVGVPASAKEAVAATQAAVAAAGSVPVTGFDLVDLLRLCGGQPSAMVDLLAELKRAGLALVASASVDQLDGPDELGLAARAGVGVSRLLVGSADGDHPLLAVHRVAAWGADVGPVHAFAPLPRTEGETPTTGYADVREVALARVLVDNIESIQVDWQRHGPKLAQVALTFGADDVDSVSPLDTMELGWRRAPLEEIIRNIRRSAQIPVQRNGRFQTVDEAA